MLAYINNKHYLCVVIEKQTTMETKDLNNNQSQKSIWDEYWANSIAEYYRTHTYTGGMFYPQHAIQ